MNSVCKRHPAEVLAGKTVRRAELAGSWVVKARGGKPLRACIDFNETSLSRARKILSTPPCKFFRRVSLTKQTQGRCYMTSFEHDVSFSETELRAAKPNFHRGRLAPALESRGANLRSSKLDEHLNRNVARARRVALLAPRATFNTYRHPLSYVSARLKLFSRGVFIKARFAPL